MPINQVSQQLNSVVMALAGAERIFALLDEESETDDGYVTLVNAAIENGKIKESKERTGIWAWKHYHKDTDTTDYIRLTGDVVFDDVDFGYTPEKLSFTMLIYMLLLVRRLPLLAQLVQEKLLLQTLLTVFMIFRTVKSDTMELILTRLKRMICVIP